MFASLTGRVAGGKRSRPAPVPRSLSRPSRRPHLAAIRPVLPTVALRARGPAPEHGRVGSPCVEHAGALAPPAVLLKSRTPGVRGDTPSRLARPAHPQAGLF